MATKATALEGRGATKRARAGNSAGRGVTKARSVNGNRENCPTTKPKPDFYKVLDKCIAERKRQIRAWQRNLGEASASRFDLHKFIEERQTQLTTLAGIRQRYERYQQDKRIPLKLRKELAGAETYALRTEFDPPRGFRASSLLSCRRDLHALFGQVERLLNPPRTRNSKFKVGQCYDESALLKTYDWDVHYVLRGNFTPTADELKEAIIAPLPTKSEYRKLKERFYTRPLAVLLDEAYLNALVVHEELEQDINCIDDSEDEDSPSEDEMGNLQDIRERLEQLVNDWPTLPACVSQLSAVYLPQGLRFEQHEGVGILWAILDAVEEYEDGHAELTKSDAEALKQFREQIVNTGNELISFELL